MNPFLVLTSILFSFLISPSIFSQTVETREVISQVRFVKEASQGVYIVEEERVVADPAPGANEVVAFNPTNFGKLCLLSFKSSERKVLGVNVVERPVVVEEFFVEIPNEEQVGTVLNPPPEEHERRERLSLSPAKGDFPVRFQPCSPR